MSTFDSAIPTILLHEGGWVSNPADPGGETNFGISTLIIKRIQMAGSLKDAQMEVVLGIPAGTMYNPGYLKPMKVEAAKKIYLDEFWAKYKYDQIADQTAATKVFDAAVNCGPARAGAFAQRAANKLTAPGPTIGVDGNLGPKSFTAINGLDGKDFVQAYALQMRNYYTDLVNRNPKLAIFLRNWLHRSSWGV